MPRRERRTKRVAWPDGRARTVEALPSRYRVIERGRQLVVLDRGVPVGSAWATRDVATPITVVSPGSRRAPTSPVPRAPLRGAARSSAERKARLAIIVGGLLVFPVSMLIAAGGDSMAALAGFAALLGLPLLVGGFLVMLALRMRASG
jgi:hypothetical protein